MIPIPVEIDAMLSIINLPKEMGDSGIFKEHRTLVLETVRSVVLPEHLPGLSRKICQMMTLC